MNFKNIRESQNYQDQTVPSGVQYLKNVVGQYLYKHGYVRGADKQYYDPNRMQPYDPRNYVPVGPDGRRSDIDWGSNAGMPGASLMSHVTNPQAQAQAQNDVLARKMGFKDAQTAMAYQQKQQAMRTGPAPAASASSGGSLLDQALAIHPAYLLQHVIDAFSKAGQ